MSTSTPDHAPDGPDRRAFLRAGAVGALGAVGTVATGCSPSPDGAGASGRLRLLTGNRGAVFARYGAALAAEVGARAPDLRAGAVTSGGSIDNLRRLAQGQGEVAFSLGDASLLALRGEPPFSAPVELVALCRLYDSFLQVLVRADADVHTLADLRGQRVEAGEGWSGTRLVVTRALEAAGLAPGSVDLVAGSLADGIERLRSGAVDALAFVSGYPIPALARAARTLPLRAIDLGGVVAPLAQRYGRQYVAGPLPAGGYRLPSGVETLSITTYLVASPALPDSVAEALTAVVFDRQASLARRVPDVRQPTVAAGIFTEPLALHPGATRWFRRRDRSLPPPGA